MQTTTLFIKNLSCTGIFGVYDFEKVEPQECIVSITVLTERAEGMSDTMADTVDYSLFIPIAQEAVAAGYALVETIAEVIAEKVLAFPMVLQVTVEAAKTKPYSPAQVGVVITRFR